MGNQRPDDLLGQLIDLLGAFRVAGANRYYLSKLLAQVGWDADALTAAAGTDDPVEALGDVLHELVQIIDSLATRTLLPPTDFAAASAFFDDLVRLVDAIKGLSGGTLGNLQLTPREPWEQLGADLWSWVVPTYLRVRFPLLYELAALLTVVKSPADLVPTTEVTAPGGSVVRAATAWSQLEFKRLFRLLQNPPEFLRGEYLKGAPLSSVNLAETLDRIFPRLAALLSELGIRSVYGMRPGMVPDFGADRGLAEQMLTINLGQSDAGEPFGVTLALSPKDADGLGLVIIPFGAPNGQSYRYQDWSIEYVLEDPDLEGLAISANKIETLPADKPFTKIGFNATKGRADDGSAILIGRHDGSYLRVRDVAVESSVTNAGGKPAAVFSALLGEGGLVIHQILNLSWAKIELALDHAVNTMQVKVDDLSLATDLVPGAKLKLDLALIFVGGQLDPTRSFVTLKEPAAHSFKLAGFEVSDQSITLTLDQASFTAGALHLGWKQLKLEFGFDGAIQADADQLQLGYGQAGQVEVSVGLRFHKGDVTLQGIKLHKPDLGDLLNANLAFTREYMALQWKAADISKLLGSLGPDLSLNKISAGELTITLRARFGASYADVREIRLDVDGAPLGSFSLPGLEVTLPHSARATVLMGGPPDSNPKRSLTDVALILSVGSGDKITVGSSFAWRDDENTAQQDRELQNEGKQNEPPLFQLTLTAKQATSIVLADFQAKGLPKLLQQVLVQQDGMTLHDLPALDFSKRATLGASDWRAESDIADDWTPAFTFNGDLQLPFLRGGDNQFVNVKMLDNPNVDLVARAITLAMQITVHVGDLKFETNVGVTISLDTFAIKITHRDGLALKADKPELTGSFFGLTWRFRGKPSSDGRFEYFALLTKNNDYRIKQVEGCLLELNYSLVGADPISFDVRNFELSEKGIGLLAKVVDRPVRLNGLDTKFRFTDSSFEIVENRIKAFTLTGSGPLPPALVGDATANIALQFEQVNGTLKLVNGGAELKGSKVLDCPETRFQFAIDAIALKFVDDGRYHLYFTLTGSASFVPAATDDKNGPLAFLPGIKIELVDCPLTGDVSVLAQHISFLVALPKPISFGFLGCFGMEVRGIGFVPQAEVFGGDGAMLLTGQVKFAEGSGDAATKQIDYHRLYIGLPEKGKFVPRLYMRDLPIALNVGEAFRLNGMVKFYDDKTTQGFSGEGTLQIQGLPTIAASFSFLRVRWDERSPWLRAWFIYLEVRQVSFMVPVVQLYVREVGLGFGYRYTLASIKAADQAKDLRQLLRELRELSRTQGNLATLGAWALDLERPGEDPRWTVVLRALIAQMSAAKSPLDWDENAEKALPNAYLFDAVIALRSDLTFFMAVRAWINTNYATFLADPSIRSKPLFSGFVLLSPRQRRLLAQLSANPNGHLGSNPELPELVQKAIRGMQFSATLLVEPGLIHYELGWPNQLGWRGKFGPLDAEFTGGFILRVSDKEFVIGNSFMARAGLEIGASVDLGFAGASIQATARVGFGARYIGVLPIKSPADFAFYGAVGLEARLDLSFNFWIGIRINLGFKKINIRKNFRLSAAINFTAGLEIGIRQSGAGVRGQGTLALSAMGHRLELSVNLSLGEDHVQWAFDRTQQYLQMGLEATEVEAVPGLASGANEAMMPAFALAAAMAEAGQDLPAFHVPGYMLFVVRRPEQHKAYFLLLPRGEDAVGFLPPPPPIVLPAAGAEPTAVVADRDDFELRLPSVPAGTVVEHFDPGTHTWSGWDPAQPKKWKADWNAVLYHVNEAGERIENGGTPIHLWRQLLGAYITQDVTGLEVPVGDPENPQIGRKLEDDRVHNPTSSAFEAAVRGAMEQFEASPFFKRDPNKEYDKLLGKAFDEKTTIYSADGTKSSAGQGPDIGQQQARQVRGAIIQEMIADLQDYADGKLRDEEITKSVAFQMGLVFQVNTPNGQLPDWLDGDGTLPTLQVRKEPNTVELATVPGDVRPFNTSSHSFSNRPPLFDRVRSYASANTIAITWDLNWRASVAAGGAEEDPDQHLQHYHVCRRALDASLDRSEGDHVFTVAPVQVLHQDENGDGRLVALRPRFQIVDHFNHESRVEQALLPTQGRTYLYTITPVDFEGNLGRSLTVTATRKPDQAPPVPTDAELVVTYKLPKNSLDLAPVGDGVPTTKPASAIARWNDPVSDREATVPAEEWHLIFRPVDVLPVGSYGLDSATTSSSTSALPTSNAIPRPGQDVRISLKNMMLEAAAPQPQAGFGRFTANLLEQLGEAGRRDLWRAQGWQVFIQAESPNGVQSALAPVKLLLRFEGEPGGEQTSFEERQVAELEWIPEPTQLALLPAEDMRGLIGDAHVPMPAALAAIPADGAGMDSLRFSEGKYGIFALHPDHRRVLRFRWNQAPSSARDNQAAFYAGYRLLMLDADAHTTEDFSDADRLAASVRPVQEIQMLPDDDRWLAPGNTLATGQWEAWYPSHVLRIAGGNAIAQARGLDPDEAPLGPWYSWRESILAWPDWEGVTIPHPKGHALAGKYARLTTLHPALGRLIQSLSEVFTVDLQLSPPMQPATLQAFLESTGPKSDPYGWGILQRLGLSVAFTLRQKPESTPTKLEKNAALRERLLRGEELIQAVQEHVKLTPDLSAVLRHLHVELLFQPAHSISLDEGNASADSLLAMLQVSLRPTIQQTSHYAAMRIMGPGGTQLHLKLAQGNAARSMIVQTTSAATEDDVRVRQVELEAGKDVEQVLELPPNGATAIVLRGSKADIEALSNADNPGTEIWFDLRKAPDFTGFGDPVAAETAFDRYFIREGNPKGIQVRLRSLTETESPRRMTKAEREVCLKALTVESDRRILDIEIAPFTRFGPTDREHGQLAAYFAADNARLAVSFEPAGQQTLDDNAPAQWLRFKRYLEMLNSPDPTVPHIAVPATAQRPAGATGPEVLSIEELLPDFLMWSRRFFEHGGGVLDTATADGPWMATAYPLTTSPAYVTPDAAGVLQYDHLLEDRWAHIYRFYIQPYSRYDLLWRSLLQSRILYPEEKLASLPGSLPDTIPLDMGALDLVVDRTYPVDSPLVLRSGRLDKPGAGNDAAQPGQTWEVIVAQHWEQALSERNQTLARQLSFRHVTFALQRRFADPDWITALQKRHSTLNIGYVENTTHALPGPYDDLSDPTADTSDDPIRLALPTRIERFQQGALAVQWDALPYFYEHRLLLVAHTTHQVSRVTTLDQRDFEYKSPTPRVVAEGVSGSGVNVTQRILTLDLSSYWDCLSDTAKMAWPDEDPAHASAGERRLASLPDPEVVYQLIEEFSGNVEVQLEIKVRVDPEFGKAVASARRLGRKYAEVTFTDNQWILPTDPTTPYRLTFTLTAEAQTQPAPAQNLSEPFNSFDGIPTDLPAELKAKVEINRDAKTLRCFGYLSSAEAEKIAGWFTDREDKVTAGELFAKTVREGARGRELKVRARRGSAAPSTPCSFDVPALLKEQ